MDLFLEQKSFHRHLTQPDISTNLPLTYVDTDFNSLTQLPLVANSKYIVLFSQIRPIQPTSDAFGNETTFKLSDLKYRFNTPTLLDL